ncbi:hypothetical protein L596_025257 [Steinernema carpocapsae]|uniref:Major facilitator superfamily (MFS) profile domain-containing protein n=1 Tax=Steinernema carpocapsae TaxID=34508 RepID=A0A4U5M7F4_STECR|nr:hypothetical protein L596_025257 [Steinernema carpocapsae]
MVAKGLEFRPISFFNCHQKWCSSLVRFRRLSLSLSVHSCLHAHICRHRFQTPDLTFRPSRSCRAVGRTAMDPPKIQYQTLPSFWVLFSVVVLSFTGTFQFGFQEATIAWSIQYFPEINLTTSNGEIYIHSFGNGRHDVNWAIIAFALGAVIGFGIFGCVHLHITMRSGMLTGSMSSFTGFIMILLGTFYPSIHVYAIGRFLFGVSTGFFVGCQILFINDVALKEYRAQLNLVSTLAPVFGWLLASVLCSPHVLGNLDAFYTIPAVGMIPQLVYVIWMFLVRHEPPLRCLLLNDERKAEKSAEFFYGKNAVDEALADAYDRIRSQPRIPSMSDLWTSATFRETRFITWAVNLAASFSGERFIFYTMRSYFVGEHLRYYVCFFIIAVLVFILVILMTFLIHAVERRTLVTISIIGVMMCELLLGLTATIRDFVPQLAFDMPACIFSVLHQLCYFLGIGTLGWFIATEVAFGGASAVFLALSMVDRMLLSIIHTAVHGILHAHSPALASLFSAVPLFGCCLVMLIYTPNLNNKEPHKILECLGYSLDLEAREEEVQEVLENLHRLWTVPVTSPEDPQLQAIQE